jgi:predicted Zn-dependent protease
MQCIKCGCPDHEDNAIYCHNCGTMLDSNFCTNPKCVMNNDDDPTPLDPSYCYCYQCGSETEYYKAGYIKPKTYNRE